MANKKKNPHLSLIEEQAVAKFLTSLKKRRFSLASLILFGSKARGDSKADSDIDLLAVIRDNRVEKQLYQKVASILSQFGIYLSVKAFTEQEFKRLSRLKIPFTENIKKEGIILWPEQ